LYLLKQKYAEEVIFCKLLLKAKSRYIYNENKYSKLYKEFLQLKENLKIKDDIRTLNENDKKDI
jgi:hypothetical protein